MAKKKEVLEHVEYSMETGETVVRPFTDEEIAMHNAAKLEVDASKLLVAENIKKREIAIAKFVALGITEEDLRAVGLNNDII